MNTVFGASNVLGSGPFGSRLNYYVTDRQYPHPTPQGGDECYPGLPDIWAPTTPTNVPDMNAPAWNCNIALSTAGVGLNLGLIVHRTPAPDRNKQNLFSSEYNSYAAILHEMSHAAFAMADEAPAGRGRFRPADHPNVFRTSDELSACQAACPGHCGDIDSTYSRCIPTPSPTADQGNLMWFFPPPAPGDNATWDQYRYHFQSIDRLDHIMDICQSGGC
jgi:hypothetical protein